MNFKTIENVYCFLKSQVAEDKFFFMTLRRSAPLSRVLRMWQRQSKLVPLGSKLMIKYIGEYGIDQGALTREFFSDTVKQIGKEMFPNGSPILSTSHIQNGYFRTCAEILAVSLAQGGPPPQFLDSAAYSCLHRPVDLLNLNDTHLTKHELRLINEVRKDVESYEEMILEHNYTGPINKDHIEQIIGALKISFVGKRMMFMQEFAKGLNAYKVNDIILNNGDLCCTLFVQDFKEQSVPDANYLFSLMVPNHSENGCSRRNKEEMIMDMFQDTLFQVEDGTIEGYDVALAEKEFNETDENADGNEPCVNFVTPEVSIPGVMQWLTGQGHKSFIQDEIKITVNFDHDCMTRAPGHTICYPVVSACAMELTFPVMHITDEEKFKEIFMLAYCKGNAFGRH